jgi:hypothetical protein
MRTQSKTEKARLLAKAAQKRRQHVENEAAVTEDVYLIELIRPAEERPIPSPLHD